MKSLGRMMMQRVRILLFALAFVAGTAAAPVLAHTQLATTELNSQTPAALVDTLQGGGFSVSNENYTGANVAGGAFTGGTRIIGFGSSAIMCSGNIASVIGPNTADNTTMNNGTAGDAYLQGLIPGFTTFDAVILVIFYNSCTKNLK